MFSDDDDFPEISPRDAMNNRVTLMRIGDSPNTSKGVTLYVEPTESIYTFMKHAAERMGINEIEKVVNIDGDVIEDVVMINPNDILYVIAKGEEEESSNGADDMEGGNGGNDRRGVTSPKTNKKKSTLTGEKVGSSSYVLGEFLGQGSFGQVHLGTHAMTKEVVALKFMSKSKLGSFQDAERVFTEIQCLNSLDHVNVIKLIQIINTPDDMVLALEYASGGDLKDVVNKYGALEEPLASRLFVQILDGVNYCHRHNIVHYDLKLDNILLVRDGDHLEEKHDEDGCDQSSLYSLKVKIADFGLSRIVNPGQTSDYTAGSLAYIAPEVFDGGVTAGPPRDIWALGVILYAMVCGRLPFGGQTYQEIMRQIKQNSYTITEKDHISESCQHLISVMLQPKPNDRMTASELRLMPWINKELPHTRSKTPTKSSLNSSRSDYVDSMHSDDNKKKQTKIATELQIATNEEEGEEAGQQQNEEEEESKDTTESTVASSSNSPVHRPGEQPLTPSINAHRRKASLSSSFDGSAKSMGSASSMSSLLRSSAHEKTGPSLLRQSSSSSNLGNSSSPSSGKKKSSSSFLPLIEPKSPATPKSPKSPKSPSMGGSKSEFIKLC